MSMRKFNQINFVHLSEVRLSLAGTFGIMVGTVVLTPVFAESLYFLYGLPALSIAAFLRMVYLTAFAVDTSEIEEKYWGATRAELLLDKLLTAILAEEGPVRERLLRNFLTEVQKSPHRYMKYFSGLDDELRGELITFCEVQMDGLEEHIRNAKVVALPGKLNTTNSLAVPKSAAGKAVSYAALKKVLVMLTNQPSTEIK